MNNSLTSQSQEADLLRRLVASGDPDAFSQITRCYSGMVYGTCLRITGDANQSADAAQETFFHLLKHANRITGSLGCWLHQVATRRAIDLVRRDVSRRQREQAFAMQTLTDTDHWADISPLLDEAMEEVNEDQRKLLVRHFLQGETMVHIAATYGVSQPTISRRVNDALAQLREKLRNKRVLVGSATLGALMSNALQEAPAAVLAQLAKMPLTISGTGGAITAGTLAGAVKLKLATAAIVTVAGLSAWILVHSWARSPVSGPTRPMSKAGVQSAAPIPPGAALALVPNANVAGAIDPGIIRCESDTAVAICGWHPNADFQWFGRTRSLGRQLVGFRGSILRRGYAHTSGAGPHDSTRGPASAVRVGPFER